jgi:prephenate dehydrogenase
MTFNKVAVLGLGQVGHLAAELLSESGFAVTGIDAGEKQAAGVGFDVVDGARSRHRSAIG